MNFSANPAIGPYWGTEMWGLSSETKAINEARRGLRESAKQTLILGWRARIQEEISRVADEHSLPGWDGDCALPVSPYLASVAYDVVEKLPEGIQHPEVAAEFRGSLALDWMNGDNVISISILGSDLLYAASIGKRQIRGKEPFSEELPETIIRILQTYFRSC